MHQLKLTLMKDKAIAIGKSKDVSNLKSNSNKSKSESMWVFDDDSQQIPQKNTSQKVNESTHFLEFKLTELLTKDKNITQTTFDRVVQEFQQMIGQGKNQISYLLVIQDKLTDLIDNMSGDKKKFFQDFIQMVDKRISEIRIFFIIQVKGKRKMISLNLTKILNNNFKKKDQLLQIPISTNPNTFLGVSGAIRQREKTPSKSRQKQVKNLRNQSRQKSSQKPLNKLLLKQKHIKKEKHEEQSDHLNQTHADQTQQSMSYSAIMSASCAVKQRNRPRRNTKRKGELQMQQNNKEDQGQEDKEKAFVFYRPKKNK